VVNLPFSLLDGPFELVDLTTGHSVPYQVTTIDDPLAPQPLAANRYARGAEGSSRGDGVRISPAHRKTLVFVAQDVPPLGYRTYRIVPAEHKPSFDSSLQVGEHSLENRYYRIALDPESGAITSIYDKELQREWVDDQAAHGFNQAVVRSPETGKETLPARSRVGRGEAGPVYASLIVRHDVTDPLIGYPQRTQEIVLYEDIKRIDFANRLLKDPTPLLELYFAFPFAIEKPQFRYEASNSVIEPIRDQLDGSNTDAYAAQHWVSAWDEGGGVVWSSLEAPVMEVGGLWPGYVSQAHHGVTPPGYGHEFLRDPAQFERGHIYSYAMVSNFRTNFQPVQVGDVLFRYSMTSHKGAWHRGCGRDFGWDASTPLVPVNAVGDQEGMLPVSSSFCQVDQPNVLVLAIKGAEDGEGLMIRLAETEGRDTVVTVALPYYEIDQAMGTNLVEENEIVLNHERHSVRVPVRADGIATVRCLGTRCWPQANRVAYH
jgi:alpha-mannosidase